MENLNLTSEREMELSFVFWLNYQRVNCIRDDDNGINVGPDLDCVDYPEWQIERINNALCVIT